MNKVILPGLFMGMGFLWESHGKRPMGWNGTGINSYGMGMEQINMSHGQPYTCPWESHGKRPMGRDRHKLLWDGNGTDKYVPWTTLDSTTCHRPLHLSAGRSRNHSSRRTVPGWLRLIDMSQPFHYFAFATLALQVLTAPRFRHFECFPHKTKQMSNTVELG